MNSFATFLVHSCINSYNWRQKELRHFALNWAFLRFTDLRRRKYSFSSPIPSMQCCADVWATYRKQTNTPTLNGGDRGGVRILLFPEGTLFEYNVSTILSPIVAAGPLPGQKVVILWWGKKTIVLIVYWLGYTNLARGMGWLEMGKYFEWMAEFILEIDK